MPILFTSVTAVLAGIVGLVAGAYVTAVVPRAVDNEPLLRPFPQLPLLPWFPWLPQRTSGASRRLVPGDAGIIAITAVVFCALTLRLGLVSLLPAYLYLAAISVALALVDIRTRRLPNAITLPSYPVAIVLLAAAAPFMADGWSHLLFALIGMAGLYVFYLLLFLIYPAGMGFGDVKLAGILGLYLGWFGIGVLLMGAFLGYLLGGIYGLVAIVAGKANRKTAIPFGPFMIGGALLGVLVGDQLVSLYLML